MQKNLTPPWRPCLSTNSIYLSNFGRGSPNDHLCQITFKSAKRFLYKFFPFVCHGNKNSAWNGDLLVTFKEGHLKIIPVKLGEIQTSNKN